MIYFFTRSFQHFLPDDDPNQLTPEAITLFLDDVLSGSAPVYGGSSYSDRYVCSIEIWIQILNFENYIYSWKCFEGPNTVGTPY